MEQVAKIKLETPSSLVFTEDSRWSNTFSIYGSEQPMQLPASPHWEPRRGGRRVFHWGVYKHPPLPNNYSLGPAAHPVPERPAGSPSTP